MDIKTDILEIINYSHGFAKQMLIEHKEFYPFGAVVNDEGNLMPYGYKDDETDMPDSTKVIDILSKSFQFELNNNKIRAYGITFDVRVPIDDKGNKSDAIAIDITHRDEVYLPIYYFTYSWNEQNELVFRESFARNR